MTVDANCTAAIALMNASINVFENCAQRVGIKFEFPSLLYRNKLGRASLFNFFVMKSPTTTLEPQEYVEIASMHLT